MGRSWQSGVEGRRAAAAAGGAGSPSLPGRRDVLRLLSLAFAAPVPVLRAAIDPLRALPRAIEEFTPRHLIGWLPPALVEPRWSDARLLREPAEALEALTLAARADGIDVWARSGYRSFYQQRMLWNAKYRGEEEVRFPDGTRGALDRGTPSEERVRRILAYTAFPGTSRHHWGTDFDLAQTFSDSCADRVLREPSPPAGEGDGEAEEQAPPEADAGGASPAPGGRRGRSADCLEVHRWLCSRAAGFGWCLVYDSARGGFEPEPWHWSYLPFAVPALVRFLEEVTPDMLRGRDIDGASAVLDDFDSYRERFLLGVHPSALPAPEPASEPEPVPDG
jgi:hypothetical protein